MPGINNYSTAKAYVCALYTAEKDQPGSPEKKTVFSQLRQCFKLDKGNVVDIYEHALPALLEGLAQLKNSQHLKSYPFLEDALKQLQKKRDSLADNSARKETQGLLSKTKNDANQSQVFDLSEGENPPCLVM